MDTWNWIDIFLAAGLIQGLVLAFLLPRHAATPLLRLLLVASSLTILLFLNTRTASDRPPQLTILMDTLAFLYGPLLYLYLQKLLFPTVAVSRWQGVYFVPAALHFGYFLAAFRYTATVFVEKAYSGAFRAGWMGILPVLLLMLWGFWGASVRLVWQFRKQEKQVRSYRYNMQYVSVFLGAMGISYVIGTLFSLDFFLGISVFSFTHANLGWIMVPFLVYFISYYAIRRPEGLYVSYTIEPAPLVSTQASEPDTVSDLSERSVFMATSHDKRGPARMTTEQVDYYKHQLEEYMRQEKPYLEPLLSLQDMAQHIGLHSTKLSWLINEHYQCNFYDYINQYRVEAFLEKVRQGDHQKHTLLSLAYEVGFNSKTTFNKAFKKITLYTPRDYIQRLSETKSVA